MIYLKINTGVDVNAQAFEKPLSEQDLVKALTHHAHKIATTVLDAPGTGMDLVRDAQVSYFNLTFDILGKWLSL